MKKALVYTKAQDGKTVGQVAMKMEASELDKWTHHHLSFAEKIEVPAELEDVPEDQLKGVLVPYQAPSWSDGTNTVYDQGDVPLVDDGQGGQIPDPAYVASAAIPEHWEIEAGDSYVAYDKANRIGEKFQTLNSEVETEMKQVYNTTNPDSAVANYLTWLSMKADPAKYSDKGLVARFEVVGLSIGDALDTDQKVTDYATALIDLADDYAIWREQKILVYASEKAAIEAE